MPHVYQGTFSVPYYECDPWYRMTPGAILRRVQDMGTLHCEEQGLNEELYWNTNTAFVLVNVSLQVHRAPMAGEIVHVSTRAYGPVRAIYFRPTILTDDKGEVLCEIHSRWVLIDTERRRIMRKRPEGFPMPFTELPEEEQHGMKYEKPENLKLAGTLSATYTLCDKNKHINNARYVDLACDLLPLEEFEKNLPRRMLMFYHNEIPMGSTFTMQTASNVAGSYYVSATPEGKRGFECFIEF